MTVTVWRAWRALLGNGECSAAGSPDARREHAEEFLCHDEAGALPRAAAARMFPIILQVITVVKSDLLARQNFATSNNPDAPVNPFGIAIGRTTVVEETRGVPFDVA